MRSADQIHVIMSEEVVDDGFAKTEADPPLVLFPIDRSIRWIGPEQIVEKAEIWNIGGTLDTLDILE